LVEKAKLVGKQFGKKSSLILKGKTCKFELNSCLENKIRLNKNCSWKFRKVWVEEFNRDFREIKWFRVDTTRKDFRSIWCIDLGLNKFKK